MAVAALISHGNIPEDITLVDEPNMLVTSLETTPRRTKREYLGANRAVGGVEFTNPILSFAFQGYVSSRTGFCDTHPGTEVTELANYDAARFGFDPSEGTLVYEDPSSTQNLEESETIAFTIVQYPFVVNS